MLTLHKILEWGVTTELLESGNDEEFGLKLVQVIHVYMGLCPVYVAIYRASGYFCL